MKVTIPDASGEEHDLEAVILAIAMDLQRLNKRLIDVETLTGIIEPPAEEEDGTGTTE